MTFWKKLLPVWMVTWLYGRILKKTLQSAEAFANNAHRPSVPNRFHVEANVSMFFKAKPDFEWASMKNRVLIGLKNQDLSILISMDRNVKLRHAFFKNKNFKEVASLFHVDEPALTVMDLPADRSVYHKAMFFQRNTGIQYMLHKAPVDPNRFVICETHNMGRTTYTLEGECLNKATPVDDFIGVLSIGTPKKLETSVVAVPAFTLLTSNFEKLSTDYEIAQAIKDEQDRVVRRARDKLKDVTHSDIEAEKLLDAVRHSLFNVSKITRDPLEGGLKISGFDQNLLNISGVDPDWLDGTVPAPTKEHFDAIYKGEESPYSVDVFRTRAVS